MASNSNDMVDCSRGLILSSGRTASSIRQYRVRANEQLRLYIHTSTLLRLITAIATAERKGAWARHRNSIHLCTMNPPLQQAFHIEDVCAKGDSSEHENEKNPAVGKKAARLPCKTWATAEASRNEVHPIPCFSGTMKAPLHSP